MGDNTRLGRSLDAKKPPERKTEKDNSSSTGQELSWEKKKAKYLGVAYSKDSYTNLTSLRSTDTKVISLSNATESMLKSTGNSNLQEEILREPSSQQDSALLWSTSEQVTFQDLLYTSTPQDTWNLFQNLESQSLVNQQALPKDTFYPSQDLETQDFSEDLSSTTDATEVSSMCSTRQRIERIAFNENREAVSPITPDFTPKYEDGEYPLLTDPNRKILDRCIIQYENQIKALIHTISKEKDQILKAPLSSYQNLAQAIEDRFKPLIKVAQIDLAKAKMTAKNFTERIEKTIQKLQKWESTSASEVENNKSGIASIQKQLLESLKGQTPETITHIKKVAASSITSLETQMQECSKRTEEYRQRHQKLEEKKREFTDKQRYANDRMTALQTLSSFYESLLETHVREASATHPNLVETFCQYNPQSAFANVFAHIQFSDEQISYSPQSFQQIQGKQAELLSSSKDIAQSHSPKQPTSENIDKKRKRKETPKETIASSQKKRDTLPNQQVLHEIARALLQH